MITALNGIKPTIKEYFKEFEGTVNFHEPQEIPLEMLMDVKRGDYICRHVFFLPDFDGCREEVFNFKLESIKNQIEKAFEKAKQ